MNLRSYRSSSRSYFTDSTRKINSEVRRSTNFEFYLPYKIVETSRLYFNLNFKYRDASFNSISYIDILYICVATNDCIYQDSTWSWNYPLISWIDERAAKCNDRRVRDARTIRRDHIKKHSCVTRQILFSTWPTSWHSLEVLRSRIERSKSELLSLNCTTTLLRSWRQKAYRNEEKSRGNGICTAINDS